MVFSWDRKPAKRKYISVKNKSIRVKYERVSPASSGEQDPVAVDAASGSIPNGISTSGSEPVDKQSEEAVFFSDALDETKVSYGEKKKKRLENWAALADELVEVGTAVLFTPPHGQCICCMQNLDQVYRCMDCGTSAVYCRECLDICHSLPHLHVFEVFKNGTFICVDTETPVWKRPDYHECQTIYCKQIVVMDEHGRQHKRIMELCGCESAAVTMIRSYLWPSSPKNPILGFHIGLLEWMTALLLECHVSTKGFCEAIKAKLSKHHKGLVDSEFKDVYRILMNECLVQYRNFRYRISHPIHLCEEIDSGIHCPACFENPQKIISFDADFQLVRKVSSGSEAGKPKHDGHFFLDQDEVDKFIDGYSTEKKKIKQEKAVHNECSEFQAGSALRSKAKNKKLDETALFGSACRHEFPHYFFNLKHGERIGYSVYLLEKLVAENKDSQMHILYDIACLLETHLKKKERTDLLDAVKLVIPIFHCYGHKMACQVLYNPRRTPGLGLTDGECLERLWAYLGKFKSISKEMTSENRVDLLVDGLMHYGDKIKRKQGKTFAERLKKAEALKVNTNRMLQETLINISGVSTDDIRRWSLEDKNRFSTGNSLARSESQEPLTRLETYAISLKKYYHLSQSLLEVVDPLVKENIRKKISGLEHVLRRHERSLTIVRWTSTSDQYKMHTESSNRKTISAKVQVMTRLMAERTFLLQMMKKYARGQAVAVRLGRQLKKVNTAVQHHLKEYNLLEGSKMPYPEKLDLDSLKSLEVPAAVPEELKRLLIDLNETKERCEEEIELIACDIRSTHCFYMKQQDAVLTSFERAESDVHRAVLLLEGLNVERCILHLRNMFSNVCIVNEVPLHFHKKLQFDLPSDEQEIPSILGNLVSDEYLLEQLDVEGYESMDSDSSSEDEADDIEMDI